MGDGDYYWCKKISRSIDRLLCPRQELNLHPTCVGQDFKSCVSTSSTTRAEDFFLARKGDSFLPGWAETKNSTAWGGTLSGRRGSNPRPQPWQGCALPTELLPHENLFRKNCFRLFTGGCKNRERMLSEKLFLNYLYCGVYSVLPGTSTSGLPM